MAGWIWKIAVTFRWPSRPACLLRRREWSDVLRATSVRVSCLSVCPLAYLKNRTSKLREIFCTCYVAVARSSSDNSAIRMYFRFVDDVVFSHSRAHVVYGDTYGRGMEVSGRQRRAVRRFTASAPPFSALPHAVSLGVHSGVWPWRWTVRCTRSAGAKSAIVLDCAGWLKPNSITLASSELAPNMFEAGSCQIPLH